MVDGKIYGLYEGDRLIYIGSTCKTLQERFSAHRRNYRSRVMPLYKYIDDRDAKWAGVSIELIEERAFDSRDELRRREGELIRERAPPYNKNVAGRTDEERDRERSAQRKAEKRAYREAHAEEIKQRERDKAAAKRKERYWSDPEFRLRRLEYGRAYRKIRNGATHKAPCG